MTETITQPSWFPAPTQCVSPVSRFDQPERLVASLEKFLCRGSLLRTHDSSGSGNSYFSAVFPPWKDIWCLQMSDMSRTHKNPTWGSFGFSAFISRQPAERSDGSPDQRDQTRLLSAWEPGQSLFFFLNFQSEPENGVFIRERFFPLKNSKILYF